MHCFALLRFALLVSFDIHSRVILLVPVLLSFFILVASSMDSEIASAYSVQFVLRLIYAPVASLFLHSPLHLACSVQNWLVLGISAFRALVGFSGMQGNK